MTFREILIAFLVGGFLVWAFANTVPGTRRQVKKAQEARAVGVDFLSLEYERFLQDKN